MKKTQSPCIDEPKLNFFFADSYYHYFSGNPANVTENSIFAVPKTHQKVMKITRFDLLRGAFIYGDQASRRVPKIKQNVAKMNQKSQQNEHEKMWISVLQWSETHVVASPAKMHENAFIFVFPGVALLTPWMQKSFKIVEN